jgi:hypothetical protein
LQQPDNRYIAEIFQRYMSPSIMLQRTLFLMPVAWGIAFGLLVLRGLAVQDYDINLVFREDPKGIGTGIHHALLYFSLPLLYLSFLIWMPISFYVYRRHKNEFQCKYV